MLVEIGLAILHFAALLFMIAVCIIGIWLIRDGTKDKFIDIVFLGIIIFCVGFGLTLLFIGYFFRML